MYENENFIQKTKLRRGQISSLHKCRKELHDSHIYKNKYAIDRDIHKE